MAGGLGSSLYKLLGRLRGRLVADLPAEVDACECHCRETECARERWDTCEKRLKRLAARRAHDTT